MGRKKYESDFATPHAARVVEEMLELLGWEVFLHPLYTPHIAPSDYHFF